MSGSEIEKSVCLHCGVDVRENTQFCYNCGKPVTDEHEIEQIIEPAPEVAVEPAEELTGEPADEVLESPVEDPVAGDAAFDETELERSFNVDAADETSTDKLAAAAASRKKARVRDRRPVEMVWEPTADGSLGLFIAITLIIAVIAAFIVFLAVYLK